MTSDVDLLDDIFDTVDALEGLDADGVANSCDEEDDEDLEALSPPKPLLIPKPKPTPPAYARGGRGVASSIGRGGRTVYTVQRPENGTDSHYFIVQYRKPQQKKHKTWDGDAYIKVEGSRITMISEEGKHMATSALVGGLPGVGSELRIGNWDCEVDRPVSFNEFKNSTSCLNNLVNAPAQYQTPHAQTPVSVRTGISRTPLRSGSVSKPFRPPSVVSQSRLGLATSRPQSPSVSTSTPTPKTGVKSAGLPKKIVIGEKSSRERDRWGGALHDPFADDALVMPRPPENEAKRRGTAINDVVVDPAISSRMRDHQKQGVEFLYRSVMGMTGANGQGCILADEMGLGKTLQTIAIIHTLCKQSPWQNESSVIGRALVVCPVSLVNNWKKEFRKWVPRGLGVVAVEDGNEVQLKAFTHHTGLNVLIIGYERLRKVIKNLTACQPPIGLIVVDEGHRLKSKDNKTTKMFDALSTSRRIMLTGTPVQNDLGEYWAMADFCNPGVFGTYAQFNRQFEKPITKSREPKCSPADYEKGKECMEALYALTKEFVLRRTAGVLEKYLPPKTEYVVFVAPTATQLDVFTQILGGGKASALLRGMSSAQLATIDLLRKVSNSPLLLCKKGEGYPDEEIESVIKEASRLIRSDGRATDVNLSGKMMVLNRILESLAHPRDEKIVIVSNWTTTLDVIQDLCISKRLNFLRLDGSTPQKQRQELVDRFNTRPWSDSAIFLLSAKAGGVGLNLIGASRLVLFDSDWNPSTDLQAMARIHRDGQKKPVFIYRLLTTNTIDEKIYQRQITKTGLSDQMMGGGTGGKGKDSKDSFSFEELRDIFSVNLYTNGCQTHDLLSCTCGGLNIVHSVDSNESTREATPAGGESADESEDEEANKGFLPASQYDPEPTSKMRRQAEAAQQAKLASLKEWQHIDPLNALSAKGVSDNLLFNLVREDFHSFGGKESETTSGTTSRSETPHEPLSKKRKGSLVDVIKEAAKEFDFEASDDGSDDEVVPAGRKRKAKPIKISLATEDTDKRYNLRTLAEKGRGGRIMYVFQKLSAPGYGKSTGEGADR